jgi:ABC-type antimicrobial peptide transport system permease subunit
MNYAVSGRTREIGVRLALGADRPAIAAMVLRDGLRLAAVGIGAGLLVAYAVSGVMAHLLVGVGPRNPLVFAGAALFLCLVALAACYVPARRAASVDPITAMRFE